MSDIEDAKDKVMMGAERRSMVMTEDDKKLTAYHEGGHAMYEQNLANSGLDIDNYLSMGCHESQPLFWERHVGLSLPFWKWATPC